jgi:hypothetical protein
MAEGGEASETTSQEKFSKIPKKFTAASPFRTAEGVQFRRA